jgi:large repetitive protein
VLVTAPPIPVSVGDDARTTVVDTPVTGVVSLTGPPGTSVTALGINPQHGAVVVQADGTYTYTPAPGFTGTDIFTIIACSPSLTRECATGTVTITVLPGPSPTPSPSPSLPVTSGPDGSLRGLVALAVALIGGGVAFAFAARRRLPDV